MCIFPSLCNIKDAITFKYVDDSIVDQVENFARTELQSILSKWKSSGKLILMKSEDYFGEIYTHNPESFKFVIGDRILILQLANYVKKIVDTKGLEYFTSQRNPISNENSIILNPSVANDCVSNIECPSQYFLKKLLSTANQNVVREKGGYRYDNEIQSFAMVFRLLSGPLAYDTLQKNLSCALPALSSVNRYIHKSNCRVNEGVLRCEELLQYLEERGLEKVVSLSEDATRIVNRVQYDSYTNQIMGFTLPVNEKNALPIPFSFPARNVYEMIGHFEAKNTVSPLVNVLMAKPISNEYAPAFCLLLYGTDNKYTCEDVTMRWQCIEDRLEKIGISVLSFSTDSDPRYNTAMKILSKLGQKSKHYPNITWFNCGDPIGDSKRISTNYFQDIPHVATKMRNFFLRSKNSPYPFGKYFIEQSHLKKLIVWFSKDEHNLSPMVLNPVDKQNYDSAMRMCDEKVTNLLRNINESQGTIKFLEIMRNIVESFMEKSLTPLQRVQKIWYSVFILRMWREYIISNKHLRLKTHFLTNNCYTCIELNAHSLVLCMIQLKNLDLSHLFLPTLFNSQHCENLFRQVRSLSSTFSTVTNCSIKEFAERISKIQLQSDVMSRVGSNFIFPRINRSDKEKSIVYDLPTLPEIYNEIEKSKHQAIRDAIVLGLIKKNKQNTFDFGCKINPYQNRRSKKRTNIRSTSYFIKQSIHRVLELNKIKLKNYAHKFIDKEVSQESNFVEVHVNPETNERKIHKKTSFCWLLRGDNERVSADRLQRVKIPTKAKKTKLQSRSHNKKRLDK